MDRDSTRKASILRRQIGALYRRLRQEAQSDTLQFSQLLVLGALERLGGRSTPSSIAASERLRSSNLAALLRDLEATECVTRSPDKDDGRRTIVSLTPHGRQMLHGYRERREQWLAMAMEADLSRDELALLMEAGKLMERLAQHGSQVDSSIARRKTK